MFNLIIDIHIMINWQLLKQGFCWPVKWPWLTIENVYVKHCKNSVLFLPQIDFWAHLRDLGFRYLIPDFPYSLAGFSLRRRKGLSLRAEFSGINYYYNRRWLIIFFNYSSATFQLCARFFSFEPVLKFAIKNAG